MTAEDHEKYPRAPVALVTVEITFPGEIGGPIPMGVQRAMGEVLGDDWVLEQVQQPMPFNLVGQAVMPNPPSFPALQILRFADRGRGTAVALTAGSMSVETTRYGNWPEFRSTLETAVKVTEGLLRPTGIVRVGVRYIDELRVGGLEPPEWDRWLSPSVLSPGALAMAKAGWPASNWSGVTQYWIGEDRQLVCRFGPQPAQPGFFVNPDGPLRRPAPRPEGPFFLLDFDASWQPSVVPRWESDSLLETCDQLRLPVRYLFDQIVG
ncbi:MAG: TIGR04255 family protein, partial [Acidimicrobiales bacterium]